MISHLLAALFLKMQSNHNTIFNLMNFVYYFGLPAKYINRYRGLKKRVSA